MVDRLSHPHLVGLVAWQVQFVGCYFDNSIVAGTEQEKRLFKACRCNNIQLSMGCSERDCGPLCTRRAHWSSILCEGNTQMAAMLSVNGGHIRIFAPDRSELGAHIPHDQEGITYADIDLHMIGYAKNAAGGAWSMS